MRCFLLCLTILLIGGNISHLIFAASLVSEPRGAQETQDDDDSDKILITPFGAQVYNPSSLGLEKGLSDTSQVAENNVIEGNQEDPLIISNDNRCRSPRAGHRKRNQPDYCQDVQPLRSQQQENGRQEKPVEDNYILPAKSNPDWAPPLKDFFEMDPCQVRPWHVCAPYLPGLDFRAWASGRLSGFDLEGCNYCMYIRPFFEVSRIKHTKEIQITAN